MTHNSAVHKSFGICNVLLNVAAGKTHAINYEFRFLLHIYKASSFFLWNASLFKVPHNVLVWRCAHTYVFLYNSSLLSACLCWPARAVRLVSWNVTVQVQRNYRLHFHWHCITHMILDTEHTISKWRVIASFILCQAGLFIDRKVKSTNATATDPREYLCLDNSARWVNMVSISLHPGSVDSAYKENTSAQIEFLH